MSDTRGRFVVFEGVDGSGKSTQAFLLSKYLGEQKVRVRTTREPGGTNIGEKIREILLDPGRDELERECEMLLYMASRAQHAAEVLKPSLEQGYVVICERYMWSTLAYQGYAGGLSTETIESIGEFAVGCVAPDLTMVLDMDPDAALSRGMRAQKGGYYDRIIRKGVEFQKKVRAGFLELAQRHPQKARVLDASRGAKEVHEEVKLLVADVL